MRRRRDYSGMNDEQLHDAAVDSVRCQQRASEWGLPQQYTQFQEIVDDMVKEMNRRTDEKLRAEGWDI